MTGIHAGIISSHVFDGHFIPTGGNVDRNSPRKTVDDIKSGVKNLSNFKTWGVEVPSDLGGSVRFTTELDR